MTTASIFSDFWNRLAANDEQGLFLVLAGFILSFAFIRMSTRLMRSPRVPWWPGSIVSDSGVHLHHLVFGIVTMMAAGALGFLAFGKSPWTEICAFAFGIGAGLTIDEFALWVYLDDVYWAEEGRSSIDATVIAAAGMGLLLVGFTPFTVESGSFSAVLGSILSAAFIFGLVAICFAKGRVLHGTFGFFIFPIAIYGACRLGKPASAWARRRYGERRPQKQARAEARFPPDRRTDRFKNAFRDVVGGKPSEGLAAAQEEAFAATREASEEVRRRAEQVTHLGDRDRDSD
jgi:branched-subunit amino acid transport protein AzlD